LEIGSKGELIPRSKFRWEPFNLHSQFYMVFGKKKNVIIKILFASSFSLVWQLSLEIFLPNSHLDKRKKKENRSSFLFIPVGREIQGAKLSRFLGVSRGNI
jgi:hypothetical protein